MKTLPIQERALKKRQALIDAAISEFSTVGFEVSTAKSVAAAAGVATGTFYQYFENKNDILRVIAAERFNSLHERIQMLDLKAFDQQGSSASFIEQQFLSTLQFVYRFHADDPELHQVLEQRRSIDPKLKSIMDSGEAVLRERVLVFVKSFNKPSSEIVAENLFAMAEGLVHRMVFDQRDIEADESLAVGAKMLASYFCSKN